jgi:hypothetical protein
MLLKKLITKTLTNMVGLHAALLFLLLRLAAMKDASFAPYSENLS